jgi:hypothetical protein
MQPWRAIRKSARRWYDRVVVHEVGGLGTFVGVQPEYGNKDSEGGDGVGFGEETFVV